MVSTASKFLFSVFFALSTMLSVDSFLAPSTFSIPLVREISDMRIQPRETCSLRAAVWKARLRPFMSGSGEMPARSIIQQREEMNRKMMEREAAYEGMKRRIRAESYEYGEADYRGLFARFDSDKNGCLDREEFENLCLQMGMRKGLLTEVEREMIWTEASNSNDGIVRVREFLRWVSNNNPLFAPIAVKEQSVKLPSSSPSKISSIGDVKRVTQRTWSYGESFLEKAELTQMQLSPEAIRSPREQPVAASSKATQDAEPVVLKTGGAQKVKDRESELSRAGELVRPWVDDSVADSQLESVVYYLLYDLGIAEHNLVGMALSAPGIFGLGVEEGLQPNVEFLR